MTSTRETIEALDVAIHELDAAVEERWHHKSSANADILRAHRARLERLEAFIHAAECHGWYECAFLDEADGMGLSECQEADQAKRNFIACYRALISQPESGATDGKNG